MELISLLWGIISLLIIIIASFLLILYIKDKEKRKLMYALGLFFSSTSFIILSLGYYQNITENTLVYNLFKWGGITYLILIFHATFEQLCWRKKKFNPVFISYLFFNTISFIIILSDVISTSFYTLFMIIGTITIIINCAALIYKYRDLSSHLFLFSVISSLVGAMIFNIIQVGSEDSWNYFSIFAFFISYAFIGLIFGATSEKETTNINGIGSYFSLQKKLNNIKNALTLSEEKYRNIVELAPDGIITADLKGYITSCNPAFSQLTGYSQQYIVGKHITQLPTMRGRDIPKYMALFGSLIRGKSQNIFEFQWVHKNRSIRFAEARAGLLKQDGKITGLQAYIRDITDEHLAKCKIMESQERYRSLFESSPDLIYIYDFKGNFIDANKAALEKTGYKREEIKHLNFTSFLDKGQLLKALKVVREVKQLGKQLEPVEFRLKTKDGRIIDIETTNSLIKHEGKAIALQGIARDITERKKIETQTKQQEQYEKLRANIWAKALLIDDEQQLIKMLYNEISTAIIFDHGSYIEIDHENKQVISKISWDKKYGERYGINETIPYTLFEHSFGKRVITFSINDIPLYAKPFVISLLKRYKIKSALMIPYGDINKPIGFFTIEDYTNPSRSWTEWEQNILQEVINIINLKSQQIFAKKEMQNAHALLLNLNKDLESKVEERTNEINRLLKQKNEFINQLGHDLKNPLNPLVNLLPILSQKTTEEKDKEMFDVIIRNVGYMKNLIVNTIKLAQLNSPNTKFSFEERTLLSEINKVIDTNKLMFDSKDITVNINVQSNVTVSIDVLRFEELLTNILNNAVKYSNPSTKIEIQAKNVDDCVIISVHDSGIGMDKTQMSQIFDEFYKADNSRHDFDSSGLGMPICKRIVEKHGGKIWAESHGIGQGTTIYFTLPTKNTMSGMKPTSYYDIRKEIDQIIQSSA